MGKILLYIVCICMFLCACNSENKLDENTNHKEMKNYANSISTGEINDRIQKISNDRIHIENNKIIKIDDIYQKEEKLVIPKGVESIDVTALKYKIKEQNKSETDFTTSQTLHICLPNSVKLKENNFVGAGPLDISFEEGRGEIERGAFREAGCNGRCFKVILPNSCKVVNEYAFYKYKGKLQLNEGLERIEAHSLSGTKCDLPDSVEYLGNYALQEWSPNKYTSTSKTADICDFKLPLSLKYIGDECIEFGEMYPSNTVIIPKGVEVIGKNAFRYLTSVDVSKKNMPHVRYKVEKGNKWFYSDKAGGLHAYTVSKDY